MCNVILGLTVSLDGFAEDINGSVGVLYPDLEALDKTEVLRESVRDTGAVVMAWKEYTMAQDPDWYAGNYEYQAPIFVFTEKLPQKYPKETDRLKFTFVTDGCETAVRQARIAAGEKDVTIIGSASTSRLCLGAGVADELRIDIIPIFLQDGFRPFEGLEARGIQLELIRATELPAGRVHIAFRICK
jgi:dihydrofolate reductase